MVEVGGYYYLSAQEIESVFCVKGSADYPYKLTVIMKSGKDYSVCYEKETARNEEKRRVLNAIETERRRDAETILNKLYLMNYTVERIDKRQLRIWQQLKKTAWSIGENRISLAGRAWSGIVPRPAA